MGAVGDAIDVLRKRTLQISSSRLKLQSAFGTRVIPAPTHDQKIGVRIDRGKQDGDLIKIYLQPNKNASNPTIKALAAANSHQNLAEAWVDTTKPIDDDSVEEVFTSCKPTPKQRAIEYRLNNLCWYRL